MSSKVALITGSSASLGAAIAQALSHDYWLVVNYRSRLEKAAIRGVEEIGSKDSDIANAGNN